MWESWTRFGFRLPPNRNAHTLAAPFTQSDNMRKTRCCVSHQIGPLSVFCTHTHRHTLHTKGTFASPITQQEAGREQPPQKDSWGYNWHKLLSCWKRSGFKAACKNTKCFSLSYTCAPLNGEFANFQEKQTLDQHERDRNPQMAIAVRA
uniref:Uncharacterized protein n=1 Tax=Sphaerodactylus townsendi TaxID=933632 RepID=A0ACB8F1T1_9SAUR